MTTLRELRTQHADLFYRQDWFDGEPFLDAPLETPLAGLPMRVTCRGTVPSDSLLLPTAVQLAELYVRTANDLVWQNYLWTSDVDHRGQRVFVGASGYGLEIHRHLAITDRWGVPLWE